MSETNAVNLSGAEARRLLQLDQRLREEAECMLNTSGLGEVFRSECFHPVGSYVMKTMTWRDLDFERSEETPDWGCHWELGTRLARIPWIWKFSCANAYDMPGCQDCGFYWGLRVSDPAGGPEWKIDLWTACEEEFAAGSPNRARWTELLSEDARVHILAIKEAVCSLPEYRRGILSVHIYEAVLDHKVRGVDEFMLWWRSKHNR